MHIELNPADCRPTSRSFHNPKTGALQTVHEQVAYLHMPGAAYPLPFKLGVSSAAEAYPAGTYVLTPESIRTNNFGNLEFNRFSMSLRPVNIQGQGSDNKPKAVNS